MAYIDIVRVVEWIMVELYVPSPNNFIPAKNPNPENICRIVAYKVPY